MIRTLCGLGAAILLSACGGGGGGSSSGAGSSTPPPTSPPPAAAANIATITVDAGPAALDTGPGAYTQDNTLYVSVTLCAPGTTNCQTIDHVQVDTGSVGLRIFQSVLSPSLLSALPVESDPSGNPVGECFGYIDGYVFGSVRQADFQIGGESVAGMPLQVMADTGVFSSVPSSCSSGGGPNLNTVQLFGANGIIGIGTTTTDCGTFCQTAGGFSSAIYYDCPSSGCAAIIARAASATAPFQQLPNPVAAMSVDNNGTIISLPASPAAGEASMTGTLYFGIGTQTNNTLGAATVLTTTLSSSPDGPGLFTAIYSGQDLNQSFLDSGSTSYLFVDNTITACSGANYLGYYCPASPLSLNPTLQGLNGATASGAFALYNAKTLLSTSFSVLPGLGANPNAVSGLMAYPSSFDFGLPFFYGRKIYTALEGRSAGGTLGPYIAF